MMDGPTSTPVTGATGEGEWRPHVKAAFMDFAEVLDALRIFPRLYLGFFLLFIWDLHQWYTGPHVAGNPDIYANLVFGSISALTGFYMGTGRKWDG
jgi:hypothetical protein